MIIIPLTRGKFSTIDDIDMNIINKYKWYCTHKGYAACRLENHRHVLMHRFILNAPEGMQVDHFDNDKLNNTRINLRLCTNAQNQGNKGINGNNTSGYKGVSKLNTGNWRAYILINKVQKHLGIYSSVLDAARAYNVAAIQYFGEFAHKYNRRIILWIYHLILYTICLTLN